MGEVRIKSGNLFVGELEQGSLGTSAGQEYPTTTRVRTKKPGVNLQAGTYTIDCVGATGGVVVYVYNKDSSWDKESSSKNWQAMPLTFSLSSEKLVRFAFRKTGDSDILPSEVTDIQLLEGTYTSETIPEYQPYFFNRPAHQVTNGQWVDIPTHHYINGRWQGELTSQSPLEFKAAGQSLLDWRIDGKTSKNLFDGTLIPTTTMGVTFRLDNDGYMYASPTNSDTRGWTYAYSQIKVTLPSGNYALCLSGTPSTSVDSGIRVNDDADKNLGKKGAINGQSTVIINFAVTDNHNIGIVAKIHDGRFRVQILKGTYTTQTITPYEPYGGVGDWDETAQKYRIPVTVNGATTNIYTDHQLLDGDSIDFSTDQTTIPIATGNNTLTVGTQVQPNKVFVKFEG